MTANGGLNKGLTNTRTQMWAITTSVEIPMNTMKESGATPWTRKQDGSYATCQSVTKVRICAFLLCEVFSSIKELDIHLMSLGARLGTNSPSALSGSNTEGMNDVLRGPLNILLQNGNAIFVNNLQLVSSATTTDDDKSE